MQQYYKLLTVIGAGLMLVAPKANAQVTPTQITAGSTGPAVVTVQGDIPEYILFTSIDSRLEMGDMKGPQYTGLPGTTADSGFVSSVAGGTYHSGNGAYVFPNQMGYDAAGNFNPAALDGKAGIQFKSNTYIVCQARVDRMRNVGPDGIEGTSDDIVLATGFSTRYRGTAARYGATTVSTGSSAPLSTPTPGFVTADTSSFATATSRGYSQYSPWRNVSGDNELFEQIIFKPGTLVPDNDTNAIYNSSGYIIKARVARHGLNDYKGAYLGKIKMTYYKF